jgi:dTDP-4-dehydrorhamnose 3,5-epimerase
MELIETGFKGLILIKPKVFIDERGYFFESFNQEKFESIGINENFIQDNQSLSNKGIVRGLHFQAPPHAQGKLVRVIKGAVQDVVVDIRKNSLTYGKSYAVDLTEENFLMLYIPAGFAHGFATLEDHTIFSYKCTDTYHPECEGGLAWNDREFAIDWAIKNPILSEKDKKYQAFSLFVSPF